jgi:hypothetical protein
MIISMRTTLVIDDELLRQVKRKAAERNATISDIVNDALRQCLERPVSAVVPFSLVTYGRSDESVSHEPSEFSAALEDEDRERIHP